MNAPLIEKIYSKSFPSAKPTMKQDDKQDILSTSFNIQRK